MSSFNPPKLLVLSIPQFSWNVRLCSLFIRNIRLESIFSNICIKIYNTTKSWNFFENKFKNLGTKFNIKLYSRVYNINGYLSSYFFWLESWAEMWRFCRKNKTLRYLHSRLTLQWKCIIFITDKILFTPNVTFLSILIKTAMRKRCRTKS